MYADISMTVSSVIQVWRTFYQNWTKDTCIEVTEQKLIC